MEGWTLRQRQQDFELSASVNGRTITTPSFQIIGRMYRNSGILQYAPRPADRRSGELLENAEISLENGYGIIDEIINNVERKQITSHALYPWAALPIEKGMCKQKHHKTGKLGKEEPEL